jgi:hypothetical protein
MKNEINRKTRKKQKTVFSPIDYQSNDGMLTTVWGPSQWHFLHTMSFNYPVNPTKMDKIRYREYMLNLKHILPCGKCRKNLVENYKKLPLKIEYMKNRESFSRYVYDLHELVNTMLNKVSGLSYDQVRERYEHFRSRCTVKPEYIPKKRTLRKKSEKGCTVPLVGEKSKCILKIVPQNQKCDTFQINSKCKKKIWKETYVDKK